MTIINPNSISGIVSVTATSNALHFYESDGDKLNINADLTGNVTGNVTGNITGTTATFSGDVTVGGVLTYDDVTNIDSVGIITARSDVSIADKIVHTGDTNTAIRFPAADTFTVETGGTEAFRVASDQKVYFGDFASAGSKAYIEKEVSGDYKLNIYASSSTSQNRIITFNSREDVEALRIDASGRVGIGTDNADYGLHVYGAGDILIEDSGNGSAHLRLRSSNNGTDVSNWKIKTSSNNFLYIENDTVGGAPAFTIDNSAKIGIKDATPSVSLDLASTTDAVALPQGTTAQRPTGSAPYIRKNTTNNALEYYDGTSWVEIITDYFPTGSVILG